MVAEAQAEAVLARILLLTLLPRSGSPRLTGREQCRLRVKLLLDKAHWGADLFLNTLKEEHNVQ